MNRSPVRRSRCRADSGRPPGQFYHPGWGAKPLEREIRGSRSVPGIVSAVSSVCSGFPAPAVGLLEIPSGQVAATLRPVPPATVPPATVPRLYSERAGRYLVEFQVEAAPQAKARHMGPTRQPAPSRGRRQSACSPSADCRPSTAVCSASGGVCAVSMQGLAQDGRGSIGRLPALRQATNDSERGIRFHGQV